ncbi:MAG: chromosome segregation protein SMC [Candidatus Jordarchaeum sp.]|uniref:chromosome segregation protein SMC n=1 Tax=Candidatus Jordarchaeum sp. TaxID=2823881 RepID=UPI00404AD227
MYIKKVVVRGFKSFGRKKVTLRLSKGFSAIVGPNGSGKSNLLDAIRFGLGVLSSKSLRVSVFSELVFTPSKDIKMTPAKYASVSLYFDNSDRRIPVDSNIVIIDRQVDRTGKSVYKLNGKAVSRTEIIDLLEIAGISPSGYNVVPQGEIFELIQMGSLERRRLFENIAGIASYDEKKERAEKELELAEQNLRENFAQISEVRNIVERLGRERETARKYQQIIDEINFARAKLIFHQLKISEVELSDILNRIETNNEQLNSLKGKEKEFRENLEELTERIEEIEKIIIEDVGARIGDLQFELSEKKAVFSEKELVLGYKEDELKKNSEKLKNLNQEVVEIGNSIKEEEVNIAELEKQEVEVDNQIKTKQNILEEISEQITTSDARFSKLRTRIRNIHEEIDKQVSKSISLKTTQEAFRKDIEYISSSISSRSAARDEIRNSLQEAEEERSRLEEVAEKSRKEVEKVTRELEELQNQQDITRREIEETEKLILNVRDEVVTIKAINEERRRLLREQTAVSEILKLRDNKKVKGIYGTISELGKTDLKYALALEVSAGGRANYIVVDDDEIAAKCINFLKNSRIGRASFLPLNRIKQTNFSIPKGNGVIGPAIDLMVFDEKFRSAFEYVFGNVAIVKNLDVARKLDLPEVRKVTIEGDIIEPKGLMSGGHYVGKTTLAFLENEKLPQLEEQLSGLSAIRIELLGKLEKISNSYLEIRGRREEEEHYRGKHSASLEHLLDEVKEKKQEITKIESEIQRQLKLKEEREKQYKKVSQEIEKIEERINALSQEEQTLNRIIEESEAADLYTQSRTIEAEVAILKEKLSGIRVQIAQSRTKVAEHLIPRMEERNKLAKEVEVDIKKTAAERDEIQKVIKPLSEQISKLEEEKKGLDDSVSRLREEDTKLKQEVTVLRNELEVTTRRSNSIELELSRLMVEKEHLENNVQLLREEAKEFTDFKIKDILKVNVHELRESIRRKEAEKKSLEPVNMLAIQLYEQERARYEDILRKREELIKERESIMEFIREVERDKRRSFLATFYSIERNFKRIFARLSPNGEGRFILENVTDPFLGGVDIEARPSGKDVKRIESMSGGEKSLTAIALIFAIQQYQPAPFYVMDEIDAFLDDDNANRVADLLKDFSKESQFIVVSLRDITITKADIVFGVTCRDGVSDVISLRMEEGEEEND